MKHTDTTSSVCLSRTLVCLMLIASHMQTLRLEIDAIFCPFEDHAMHGILFVLFLFEKIFEKN